MKRETAKLLQSWWVGTISDKEFYDAMREMLARYSD